MVPAGGDPADRIYSLLPVRPFGPEKSLIQKEDQKQ